MNQICFELDPCFYSFKHAFFLYNLVLINLYVIIHMAETIDLTMFPTDLSCLVKLLKNKISYMANVLEISDDCKDVLDSLQNYSTFKKFLCVRL